MTVLVGTKLNRMSDGSLMFSCPGCNESRRVTVGEGPGPRWGWNGSGDTPTFTPSIPVRSGHFVQPNGKHCDKSGDPEWPCNCACCHSFITDGRIQFLGDLHPCAGGANGRIAELAPMIRLLTSLLTGGIPDKLLRAYEAKLSAANGAERLVAESQIRALEIAMANQLATTDNAGLRWAIGIVALALSVHLALEVFVSAFPQSGWAVHALPAPMNDWHGRIILSFFGLLPVRAGFRR